MSDVWKARLLPASFRGIPFEVESHTFSGGRNAISHEPPDRDETFAEDLGRQTQSFRLTAYILGDNYFFLRDALISAMEEKESGTLIHPFLGPKEVQPGAFSVTESEKDGRIATFSLQFVEAGDPSFPFAAIDAVTDLITKAVATVAVVQNAFQVVFSVASLPGFAISAAEELIVDAADAILSSANNVRILPESKSALQKAVDDYKANKSVLVRAPGSLAAETDVIISSLVDATFEAEDSFTIDTSQGRDDSLAIFDSLVAFAPAPTGIETSTRILQDANTVAYGNLVRRIAIAQLSIASVSKEFDSTDSALVQRNNLVELIEDELNTEGISDEEFNSLEDLKAAITASIPNESGSTQSIASLTLTKVTSSLELVYDLYEALDNEQDIISRNAVRNPANISGDLEVLSG